MIYAITGATGNTGHVVVRGLLAKGQRVRAIGRNAQSLQMLAREGAEPFVADLNDAAGLSRAFKGPQAVYVMLPGNPSSPDYRADQDRLIDAIATALEQAAVQHAVVLSSIGADKPDKTGPVVGLHRLEQRLGRIAGLKALFLRAGYFMENTLPQLGAIESLGKTVGAFRPDLALPMIATRDIGAAAAEALARLDFEPGQTRELLGQRDLTMPEAASIIGKAIRRPDLAYARVPEEQFQAALTQFGMSQSVARLLVEMVGALNSGYMKALESRSVQNTTPTPFETFVAEEFLPRYQTRAKAA